MNREWLALRLISPLALFTLGACAGGGGNAEPPQSQGNERYQGQFPERADLIDDIRNGGFLGGDGAETGSAGGGGGRGSTSTGIPLHGDPPLILGDGAGPYFVDSYLGLTGTIYYPIGAQEPFAGLSLCGGFLNVGYEMSDWGSFYASWGIVTLITDTSPIDLPDDRAWNLAGSIDELKAENTNPLSPLFQKMSGRYGTSGYSMGGGGTTIASSNDWSLNVSIGMAPWLPTGFLVQTPTLLMCGDIDVIAACEMAEAAYDEIPDSTPKMLIMLGPGLGHLGWFGPDAAFGQGGGLGLAFAKTYLEGDERWKAPLLGAAGGAYTNIW
jgi:hypothetical protein